LVQNNGDIFDEPTNRLIKLLMYQTFVYFVRCFVSILELALMLYPH